MTSALGRELEWKHPATPTAKGTLTEVCDYSYKLILPETEGFVKPLPLDSFTLIDDPLVHSDRPGGDRYRPRDRLSQWNTERLQAGNLFELECLCGLGWSRSRRTDTLYL